MLKADHGKLRLGLGGKPSLSFSPRIDYNLLCSIRRDLRGYQHTNPHPLVSMHYTKLAEYSLTSVWLIHLYIVYSISSWRRQGGDWFGTLWGNGCYRCDCPSPATPTCAGNTGQSGRTVEPLHMLLVSSRQLFVASNALRVSITLDPLTGKST